MTHDQRAGSLAVTRRAVSKPQLEADIDRIGPAPQRRDERLFQRDSKYLGAACGDLPTAFHGIRLLASTIPSLLAAKASVMLRAWTRGLVVATACTSIGRKPAPSTDTRC